jgi:hypothetical protein
VSQVTAGDTIALCRGPSLAYRYHLIQFGPSHVLHSPAEDSPFTPHLWRIVHKRHGLALFEMDGSDSIVVFLGELDDLGKFSTILMRKRNRIYLKVAL